MPLDDLLDRTRPTAPPDHEVLRRSRAEALAALDASLRRQARIVRHRRHRRYALGAVAAAAATVVGVGALTNGHQSAPPGASHPPARSAPTTPPVVHPRFTTVAQVVRAAGSAPTAALGSAPYWKVVTDYRTTGCTTAVSGATTCAPSYGHRTAWTGIGRPGVIEDTQFGDARVSIPDEGITVDGQRLSWPEFNSRSWTTAQLATLVADSVPSGKPGRAPSSWYVFKNTGDLLAESPASATIRKQLWRMLGQVEGVTLTGDVADHAGRHGWELRLSVPGYGSESYLVDPGSGALLESRVHQHGQAPTWATYLSAGPATTAPAATE